MSRSPDKELSSAFKRLCEANGTLEECRAITGVPASALSNYGNVNREYHAPIDVVAALEAHCGQPIVTMVLARRAGHDLVQAERSESKAETMRRHLADIARTTGELQAAMAAADVDGVVDLAEERAMKAARAVARAEAA